MDLQFDGSGTEGHVLKSTSYPQLLWAEAESRSSPFH